MAAAAVSLRKRRVFFRGSRRIDHVRVTDKAGKVAVYDTHQPLEIGGMGIVTGRAQALRNRRVDMRALRD